MKLKGIFGKGSGKLGNAVFAVSGGEQLVKEYNPRVSNPNTPAQVEQRAKFKLMSQLAAVFAPAMGFRKMGLVSARNQFVSKNIVSATYAEEKAGFELGDLKLTAGSTVCPTYVVQEPAQGVSQVALAEAAPENIVGMVYVSVAGVGDDKVVVKDVQLIMTAGSGRTFPGSVKVGASNQIFFAYGIVASNGASESVYSNMAADMENRDVSLAIDLLVKNGAVTFTDTEYNEL